MARRKPGNSGFWQGTPPSWTALTNWYRAVVLTTDDANIHLARIDLMLMESTLNSLAWLDDDRRVERFIDALREQPWPGGRTWADKAEEDLSRARWGS